MEQTLPSSSLNPSCCFPGPLLQFGASQPLVLQLPRASPDPSRGPGVIAPSPSSLRSQGGWCGLSHTAPAPKNSIHAQGLHAGSAPPELGYHHEMKSSHFSSKITFISLVALTSVCFISNIHADRELTPTAELGQHHGLHCVLLPAALWPRRRADR